MTSPRRACNVAPRRGDAGLTLVEMLVALVLFALVGLASFTTLDAIIRVRDRTDGRLEQIARIDRALQLFSRDLIQSAAGEVSLADGVLRVGRPTGSPLSWQMTDGALVRSVDAVGSAGGMDQTLLPDIATVTFRVRDLAGGWSDVWPVAEDGPDPAGVEMAVDLGPDQGTLLRLAPVPRKLPEDRASDVLFGDAATGDVVPATQP
ncbi:MAG: prepilin-type N-terminal cleavage/methylation domain-containing protein [Alphaproteobacteria bacterium]|nr:prepilin-type N-terminal cleavage/methylation domain-containing protein [Alphaproteobacteria bacterium]